MPDGPNRLVTRWQRECVLPFWHHVGSGVAPHPLLIWLHGAGSKGSSVERLREEPIFTAARRNAPQWSVLAPLCPAERSGWEVAAIVALIDHAIAVGWADPQRVFIAGSSMGGRGAYEVAYDHADRLAGIIAIAAAGLPTLMPRLQHLPCWIAHGRDDRVVPVTWARWVAEACPHAHYHELPATGHDCTATVVEDPDLWQWLQAIAQPSLSEVPLSSWRT